MTIRSNPTFTEQGRRRQIVDAAIEVIAAEGFAAASVARIAKQAGVAKSAVLYYFDGKDALVAAIVEWVMGDAAATFARAVLAETTALGRVTAYIRGSAAGGRPRRGHRLAAALPGVDHGKRRRTSASASAVRTLRSAFAAPGFDDCCRTPRTVRGRFEGVRASPNRTGEHVR